MLNDRGKNADSSLLNLWLSLALGCIVILLGLIYLNTPSLKEDKAPTSEPTIEGPSVFAKSDLNIRSGPSTSTPVVRRAIEGEQLFYDEKQGGWYHLRSGLEQDEWVHQSVVSLTSYKIDIPELLGSTAYQIQQIMKKNHGKPAIFKKPAKHKTGEAVGTMFWKIGDLRFGFDFYQNGDIGSKRDGRLVFVGFKDKGLSTASMLRAGNLREGSPGYKLKVTTLGSMIEVLIMPPL